MHESTTLVCYSALEDHKSGGSFGVALASLPGDRSASLFSAGIVVVEARRLEEVHWNAPGHVGDELASDQWASDQGNEDDKHDEVKDGVTDDSPPAQLGLLKRVDWWANLSAWT